MTTAAGTVATEAMLVTVAQRHLTGNFPDLRVTRGDGHVTFHLGAAMKRDKELSDALERLGQFVMRELTGKPRVRHGDVGDIDFSDLRDKAVSFSELMGLTSDTTGTDMTTQSGMFAALPDFSDLPAHDGVAQMLELLYNDSLSKTKNFTCVTKFPKHLNPSELRMDVAVGGSVVVSCATNVEPLDDADMSVSLASKAGTAIVLQSRALAKIVAPFASTPVEAELPTQWRLRMFSLEEVTEVLAVVHTAIKQYWTKSNKTEKIRTNVTSLLAIVSGDLKDFIREQLAIEANDANGAWRMPISVLKRAETACATWARQLKDLTVEGSLDGWPAGEYIDESAQELLYRLESTTRLRALLDQTSQFLGRQDQRDVDPETLFEGLHITDLGKITTQKWHAGVDKFEHEFGVFESSLIGKLRSQWQSFAADGGDRTLRAASEMRELLQRERVANALAEELRGVAMYLDGLLKEANQRHAARLQRATNAYDKLRACRDVIAEAAPVMESAKAVLGSPELLDSVANAVRSTIATARVAMDSAFKAWQEEATSTIERLAGADTKLITVLRRKHPVDPEGLPHLALSIARELETFLTEVVQVTAMYNNAVTALNTSAQRSLADLRNVQGMGRRMQHLAATFNMLSGQVLSCTRGMLAGPLAKCEAILMANGESSRYFAATQGPEMDAVVSKMHHSLEVVAADNRAVRRLHNELVHSVSGLFSIDLLRNAEQWKATLKELRTKFENFEKHQSITGPGLDVWKRHWDYQLYKALEHQYQAGLEQLNESVEPFKVSLIFKQGGIHFKPGFEALREQYYGKIREFISIPNRFKGVANAEFFGQLPSRNAEAIGRVHGKAMELFQKLGKLRRQFRDFVVVGVCGMNGAFDLDTIVAAGANTVEQWEAGLQLCKERLKKAQAVQEKIVVECVEVNTEQIKATMEENVHKLEESLINALRRATQQRLNEVDDFVHFASGIIDRQPTTLDEVGKANKAYIEFKEQLPAMEEKLAAQDQLQKLLKAVTGTTVDMSLTKSRWDHLMDSMQSHQKQIDASVAKMRQSVDSLIAKFLKDVTRFTDHWNKNKPKDLAVITKSKQNLDKALSYVKDQALEIDELAATGKELLEKCSYFKVHTPDFGQLEATKTDVGSHNKMWAFYEAFEEALDELRNEDWLTFRAKTYRFDDLLKEWEERMGTELDAEGIVPAFLAKRFADWREVTPLFKFVRGEGFLPEHWNELFRFLEIEKGMTSDKLSFGHVLDKAANIIKHESDLKGLHGRAQGEVQIRDALQELRTWSMEQCFTLITPNDGSGNAPRVQLISEWKDVMTQVSDHQALLTSLKDSSYFPRFADEAGVWEQKLLFVNDCLGLLNNIQRRWVYLEPLFARGALPQEQQRFKRVDKEFVAILKEVEQDPRVMSLASHTDYADKLKAILEQIERCQKALNEFLEQKRDKFPRFYFISDEDLLEILGQSKNPAVIQSHLKKLFMGINSVKFNDNSTSITHMVSSDGEVVLLAQPVDITDPDVEDWLIRLDECMRKTLRVLLSQCAALETATDPSAIDKYPSQILQTAEQAIFTRLIETKAIPRGSSGGFFEAKNSLQERLETLTSIDVSTDYVLELKVKALIMDVIHMIEVVDQLEAAGLKAASEWQWQKQLRYYVDGENCVLRMVDTQFNYSFEYQGNAAKLVHTPLTDRCYLTLTKGMHLGYGGNLYGPAGTGKTESVKALGGALGRQVLVFNCDEGIDFKAMGRIFVGIVKCGAWGCFDEFNRLKVDQLSAISQMIQVIQEALKQGEPNCTLLGRLIDVSANSGIFVTLNPAGKGYGGRSKLPDNLKLLFRAVAMSVPNSELITETMLLSEGFQFARALAPKVVEVYKLSKQLLSPQQHYDWGLRPLKAVLRLGGALVQKLRKDKSAPERTEAIEAELMVQSLRVNTLSKLTFSDATLFNGIIDDIFPKIAVRDIKYEELAAAVKDATTQLGLQHSETQVHKVMQLYEAMNQRMGVVLVGPSGSGKSTLLKILRRSLEILGTEVPLHVMNPKALPRQLLLGHMDVDTREWYDGVLSTAARKVVKEPQTTRSWIFCDGDIDPEWVESLNSVLDDNRLLTMPNGVRIQFGSNVNFVFETHSLQFASPATVSRMGIIFLSQEDVEPSHVVESYAATHMSAEARERVLPWISEHAFPLITSAMEQGTFSVETTRMGLVTATLAHTQAAVNLSDFSCRLMRALSGFMPVESQAAFAAKVFAKTGATPASRDNVLDCYFDADKNRDESFSQPHNVAREVAPDQLTAATRGDIPMVRTFEVQRTLKTLEPLIAGDEGKPFFLVGPEGCGKTLVLANCFNSLKSVRIATINCSAQTTSAQVIQKLQQQCSVFSTSAGKVLRPKEADRLVLVFKDISLPKADKYGTVMLHSLLQQLLLYRGFYDEELEWVGIEKVQIVGSMTSAASSGGFPMSPRLLAIVNIVTIGYPTDASLKLVYSAFFSALVRSPNFVDGRQYDDGKELATCAVSLYNKMKKRFGGENYRYCVFCPRDVTGIVLNALRYDTTGSSLDAVFAHESARIFTDRLPKADDRVKAQRILAEELATLGHTFQKEGQPLPIYTAAASEWVVYNTPAEAARTPVGTRAMSVSTPDDVKKAIDKTAIAYSREFGDVDIPLIPEMVEWVARVERALAAPGGHVLLAGRAGVGRRAAVTVASYALKMQLVRLNMGREYNMKSFRSDLKAVIAKATTENERVAVLIEDHSVFSEDVLEMVNSLISSGEVPGLYSPEEIDQLMPALREPAADEGFTGPVYQFFLQRLRTNLRLCLVMDPRNALFGVRCASNPALLTRCAVLWMDQWSDEGMKLLCKSLHRDVLKESLKDDDKLNVPHELITMHKSLGDRATPELFKSVMHAFRHVFQAKSKATRESAQRLGAGLQKLNEAQEQVDKTKVEVQEKMKEVERKQSEADEALTEIQQNMADSADQRQKAEELTEQLDEEKKIIAVKSEKIEGELSTITPMLEAAREAVSGIKSENLNEIRSLKTPPEAIRDVLEGVLGLLGVQDTTWSGMRKFLGERGSKERIIAFDAKAVTASAREHVQKILTQRGNSFKHENIVRASVAAAPLASWVKANVEYSRVLDRIDPLRQSLQELEDNKALAEEKLGKLKDKLKKIDKNVEKLRKDFARRCKEAEQLKEALEKAEKQLDTAEKLLSGLSDERTRWGQQSKEIEAVLKTIPRKAVVSAGFMTYLGEESEDRREHYIGKWCGRLKIDKLAVGAFLRSESALLKMKAEGLPGDTLSMENAVVMLDSNQTPLVIDPATQAMDWLVQHLKNNDTTVEVASISDERFTHSLELAIRFGKTFIATEIDRIDPVLFPVLRRDLVSLGPKKVVQLGSKQVDWQETFKIFLFTRTTDLVLPPDAAALVTVVNFSVTRSGLQSQLLGATIQHEQPEMEKQKIDLLHKEEALKVQLADLEESLLNDLANSHGNLLDNTQLIESLSTIKTQSKDIGESLAQSKTLQVELTQKREVFRPLAIVGATMYFLIQEMTALNRMYQFSLAAYLDIFQRNLSEYAGQTDDFDAKMDELSQTLCRRAFLYVTRGLFKNDRIQFGLHVVRGLDPEAFPQGLWDVLIGKSKQAADGVTVPSWANGNANVISEDLQAIHAVDPEALARWSLQDSSRWTAWLGAADAEAQIVEQLGAMDALLFTSVFYRELLVAVMNRVVLKRLGLDAVAEVTTIEKLLPETTATMPIMLITSAGADPSLEVQEVAWKTVGRERFTQIALGGGQTDEALAQVRRCAIAGEWIFLKNLHLVLGWVPTLEKEVCAMTNPHADFRLFLTTEPHDAFPSVLLKSSLKVTIESPPGVKQNMLNVYGGWSSEMLASRSTVCAQLLFTLAWFHAVIAERRSYIPQGWVKFYEFTPADLRSAADIISATVGDGKKVDWTTLRGIFDDAVYGGRLDNDQDMRVLKVFLRRIFCDDVSLKGSTPLFQRLSVPTSNDHAEHMTVINALPDINHTAMFQLPVNADNVVREVQGTKFRGDLKTLAAGAVVAVGSGVGTLGQTLGDVWKLWEASPVAAPPTPPEIATQGDSFPDPVEVFIVSELGMLAKLIGTVRDLFAHMKDVIDGTALPNGALKSAASALAAFSTPDPWFDKMPASESLGAWLTTLGRKQQQTAQWHQMYKAGNLLSSRLNLSDLLRPGTFLNALRQFTARKSGVPLAALRLRAVAGASQVPGAKINVALSGDSLVIQGALADGTDRLKVPVNDTPSTTPFGDVVVGWTNADDQPAVRLPMYTNASRELHLLDVAMSGVAATEADDWVLRGAAILLA